MNTMKGVSDIIATILMLVIVISMAAFAFTYMSGIFSRETSVVLSVDQSSYCNGISMTVLVQNSGTMAINATKVRISAIAANGTTIPEAYCTAIVTDMINASSIYQCTNNLIGSPGFNTVKVRDPTGRYKQSVVQCVG
jgi:flagellin-like protein